MRTIFSILRAGRWLAALVLASGLLAPAAGRAQAVFGTLDPAPFYHWQHPRPVGEHLVDLHVFNDSAAAALSSSNYVVHTADRGKSWRYVAAGSVLGDDYPQRLTFVGDTLGWLAQAVGSKLRVKRTLNGGRSWATCLEQSFYGGTGAVDLQFVTRKHGFLLYQSGIYNQLVRTTDGGQTWTPQTAAVDFANVPGRYGDPRDLHFISPTEGWAAFGVTFNGIPRGSILHTTDGGQTWKRQTPQRDSTVEYLAVGFARDGQHGWVFSSNVGPCYRTTDGGRSWVLMPIHATYGDRVCVVDAQHVTIGGAATSDGGMTWTFQAQLQGFDINQIRLTAAGRGWGLGRTGNLFRTTGYGQQWQPDSAVAPAYRSMRGFAFHGDARRGWALRAGSFPMRTTTGGRRWTAVDETRAVPAEWQAHGGYQVLDAAAVDFDTATVLVNHRLDVSTFSYVQDLLRTTDGGQTWQVQQLPPQAQALNNIVFYNSRHGCLAGYDGSVYITHDGGDNWQQTPTGTTQPLTQISWASPTRLNLTFVDNSTGNSQLSLLLSEDGGATWQKIPAPGGYFFSPVAWRTAREAWVEGSRTNLYRSTDGGHTWATVPISISPASIPTFSRNSLAGITFLDSTRAVAADLRPVYSADKGHTWTATSLNSILPPVVGLLDRYNGWFGGDGSNGATNGILRYSEKSLYADTALARTSYCVGEKLTLAFARVGSFGSDEQTVVAELSDAHGRFGLYPLVVGQGSTSPLAVTLPTNLPPGASYLLRVSRPDHSVLGMDNLHELTVNALPAAPVVRQLAGGQLTVSQPVAGAAYQWYRNGQLLAGATGPAYPAGGGPVPLAGSYAVVATVGGCASAPSAPLAVVLATAGPAALAEVRLYPNPAHGTATLALPAALLAADAATLCDALGQVLRRYALPTGQGSYQLGLAGLPPGVYGLRVPTAQGVVVRRLVVE